jgi:hypothetical protein
MRLCRALLLLLFICGVNLKNVRAERQLLAKIHSYYQSFHSMNIESELFVEEKEGMLIDDKNAALWVHVLFSDMSSRAAVKSKVNLSYYIDENYPNIPEKWVKKFQYSVTDGSTSQLGAKKVRSKQKYVKIPGNVYDFSKPIQKVKLVIDARSAAKYGWSARKHSKERIFYVAPHPRFRNKKIQTKALLKLSGWSNSRSVILDALSQMFLEFRDPAYKLKDDEVPKNKMRRYLKYLNEYMGKYYDEIDFKAYLAEFIIAYSRGIEEKIDFPVEWGSFLGVPDKDFNLRNLTPSTQDLMFGFDNSLRANRHFLALVRLVADELGLLEKMKVIQEVSAEELNRLAVFMDIKNRNGFIDRVNLLRKTEQRKIEAFSAVAIDLKRMLGWDEQGFRWLPLERSPIYETANNLMLKDTRKREFIDATVIEAVRGLYWSLFFVVASEDYFSRVFVELADTALGIFQLAPPQISFSLDNQILFNGDDGILIARVYNPSKYIALNNVHLLMEKKNLRRLLFYRGDNLQTVKMLRPQEVKYVFFRFSCIGIGTDVPVMRLRYNRDFESEVRVGPVTVMRKDEFISQKMEQLQNVVEKDVYNSYSHLRDKLEKFQNKMMKKRWQHEQSVRNNK